MGDVLVCYLALLVWILRRGEGRVQCRNVRAPDGQDEVRCFFFVGMCAKRLPLPSGSIKARVNSTETPLQSLFCVIVRNSGLTRLDDPLVQSVMDGSTLSAFQRFRACLRHEGFCTQRVKARTKQHFRHHSSPNSTS